MPPAAQYLANFFVSEARRNTQNFTDPILAANLMIYKYPPVWLGGANQVYFFS